MEPGESTASTVGGGKRTVSWEAELRASDVWGDSALIDAYDRAISRVKEEIAQLRNAAVAEPEKESSCPSRKCAAKAQSSGTAVPLSATNPMKPRIWKEDDYCRALYSGDGKLYEAQIKMVDNSLGACLVRYIGYGNEEEVQMEHIQPSHGRAARRLQLIQAREIKRNADVKASGSTIPPEVGSYYKEGGSCAGAAAQPTTTATQQTTCPSLSNLSSSYAYCQYCNQPLCQTRSASNVQNLSSINIPPPENLESSVIPPPPPFPLTVKGDSDTESLSIMLISWYLSGYHTGFYHGSRNRSNSTATTN